MLLSRARPIVSLSPWTVRIRPAPSVTATTPPTFSTSLAITAAAPPSWANTISCSSECSEEGPSCAHAGGAMLRLGSTWYCSRQRYQDVTTSGRTPRTRSSPARNLSRAAVTARYRSASLLPWRFAVWLMCETKIYLESATRSQDPPRTDAYRVFTQATAPPAVEVSRGHNPGKFGRTVLERRNPHMEPL